MEQENGRMEEEKGRMEEEKGITLRDVFNVIKKKIWIAVGAAAVFGIGAGLFTGLYYNTSREKYKLEVTLRYNDDYGFNAEELVKKENLSSIIVNNKAYGYLDDKLDKIVEEKWISVSSGKPTTENGITTTVCTFYGLADLFLDDNSALRFIQLIVQSATDDMKDVAKDNAHLNLNYYQDSVNYATKVRNLQDAQTYLLTRYTSLMATYGPSYKVKGRTLLDYNREATTTYSLEDWEKLLNEIEVVGYVSPEDTEGRTSLTAERDFLKQKSSLTEEEKSRLETVELILTEGYSDSFAERLNGIYEKVTGLADTFNEVYGQIYAENMAAKYDKDDFARSGGINNVISVIGGIIAGFAVVGCIICAVDMPKYLKQKERS